jgi:hypothetical protein
LPAEAGKITAGYQRNTAAITADHSEKQHDIGDKITTFFPEPFETVISLNRPYSLRFPSPEAYERRSPTVQQQ